MPKSNIVIIWTPLCECFVVRCGCKSGHQKDTCLKEIELHTQNVLTILGSVGASHSKHYWGDLYDHLMRMKSFTLILNKMFI
jgi:hypothetical protein